jgi:hypothetical protein
MILDFFAILIFVWIPTIRGDVRCLKTENGRTLIPAVSNDCCNVMISWLRMGKSIAIHNSRREDPHATYEHCCGYRIPGLQCSHQGSSTTVYGIEWDNQSLWGKLPIVLFRLRHLALL